MYQSLCRTFCALAAYALHVINTDSRTVGRSTVCVRRASVASPSRFVSGLRQHLLLILARQF